MTDKICSIASCDRPIKGSHGWCNAHYQRWWRYGDPLGGGPMKPQSHESTCSIDGCDRPYFGRGWCNAHWTRWRRHGDPLGGGTSHDPNRRCENHPDRRARGRGLCGSCLQRDRINNLQRTTKRCVNHPKQPEFARGLCNSCYQSALRIKNKYGLTVEEYRQYMEQSCGICGGPADALDHDHVTGQVRGSLCTRCNVNLGVIENWFLPYREQIEAWIDTDSKKQLGAST
jgi:hypothetical protein